MFEISTDKVDSEIPSPASGTLDEILVREGETIKINTTLAVIREDADAAGDMEGEPVQKGSTDQPAEKERPQEEEKEPRNNFV